MAKVLGLDLDGTIIKNNLDSFSKGRFPLPSFIYSLGVLCLNFIFVPDEKFREKIKEYKNGGYRIVIISARPADLLILTVRWLVKNNIPFDDIILVGPKNSEEKKLKIIMREEISIFIDDDHKTVNYLNRFGINAILKGDAFNQASPFIFMVEYNA